MSPGLRVLCGALVALLALGGARSVSAQGAVLRVGVAALPGTLDPAGAAEGSAAIVTRQVFDRLVHYREGSSDVEPGLAAQWSVARDGLSWSFRLREGVRFHDGTPLTAQHVAVSLERLLFPGHPQAPERNPVVPRLLRGTPGVVKEIRAPDARTVQIHLVLPYAPLLTVLAHPALGIARAVTGPDGGTRWIGTGPFSPAEVGPGRIALDAHAAHWGGAPRVGRLIFLEYPELERGEADLDQGALDVLIPAAAPSRLAGALSVPGWGLGYLAMQTERDPFSRKKVRQAVAAGLDLQAIGAAVEPAAAPLPSFLPPGVWGSAGARAGWNARPEVARRLLAEAGLGRGISSSLLVAPLGPGIDAARLVEAVQGALGRAAIGVTAPPEPPEVALRMARSGEHQMVLVEVLAEGGDPHLLLYPLSTSEGATKGAAALNLSFFRDRRLDDLLIRGSQLSFRPERQRVYARAQALLADEVPWVPLYVRRHWAVARPEVRNLRLHPSGFHRLDRVVLEPPPLAPAPLPAPRP
ncbi:MAG: hypothetical protein HYV93_18950 [Candidatus Rokubacteria bacterium]|nr:hypothetical protein [Candidatus Rokubacteria bacterium]